MAKQPPKLRNRLRQFIEAHLSSLELAEPTEHEADLESLLNMVLTGLDDLDHGEIPLIFKPAVGKRRGKWPAQIRRLQIWAIRHVAALRRREMTLEKARSAVADEFKVSSETVRSWRKKLISESKAELEEALRTDRQVERTHHKMGWPVPSPAQILKYARRHGDELRRLRSAGKKKSKKKPG